MLSFKRLLYIVLIVAILGGIFLIYSINMSRPASARVQSAPDAEREFTETGQVDEGEKPGVWIFGHSGDGRYGEIYSNVVQLCKDLHLTVTEEKNLDTSALKEQDLVIFCDTFISRYADTAEFEEFIAGGGRAILAAGFSEENEDSQLWPALGIREKSAGKDYHNLVFEKPLFPVQPEKAYYDGDSGSARLKVERDASVYIRDAKDNVPVVYTYDWQKGSICLINGNFLTDVRCMGLLTGAIAVLLPDFVYPVLGVKAVFLDSFPRITSAGDKLYRRVYGYSTEGFVRDVVWPAFQGISLRTDTPYTSSILAAASLRESFGTAGDTLFMTIGKSVLQFGGELAYAADCRKEGEVIFNESLIDRFSEEFPGYTVQGMVMETDNFSPEMLSVPGASVTSVRGPSGRDIRFSCENGYTVFPAATEGNSMDDGSLFDIYSVLGAYGMVSHVFDVGMLLFRDEDTATWDQDRRQIDLFESEVLTHVPWLEGRTLSQTVSDVKSYLNMDYSFTKSGGRMEIRCSSIAKGQAFFYHTESRITGAKGLTYEDVGNGYYLLRIQENHGIITLEEGE